MKDERATLLGALTYAIPILDAAGVETPRRDAELLLAHALGRDRTYLFAHTHDPLPAETAGLFDELVRRRAAREPLPYLIGAWEFMGMPFRVTPAVLIPRPETEVLVEAAARLVEGPGLRVECAAGSVSILDVGAGSGCIAISLATLLPGARVTALEPCRESLEVTRANAAALGVADRVSLLQGWFPGDAAGLGPFDAIVSNPPYIPTGEIDSLDPELRIYEPRLALDGGPDGLCVHRALARHAPELLAPGGFLAVEVARGQAEAVIRLLQLAGAWQEPEIVPDLAGIARVVVARRL